MTNDYLPKHATTAQACEWLQAQTGESWTLARLLETGLMPWFWLDYKPGYPAIFGNRVEGYLAPMVFTGDTQRLEADGADAVVTMTRTHDGQLIKIEPGIRVPNSELRFKRDDVQALSKALQATAPAQNTATPAPAEPENASGAIKLLPENEPMRNAATGPVFSMTKAAMVAQHEHEWPSILGDMKVANTNGLAAAKAGPRGWHESYAMAWARSNDKLTSGAKSAAALTQAMRSMGNLSGRKHKL